MVGMDDKFHLNQAPEGRCQAPGGKGGQEVALEVEAKLEHCSDPGNILGKDQHMSLYL